MKLLQQCFLFFIVVVIPGHNLGNSQVSVNRTIGPTLVYSYFSQLNTHSRIQEIVNYSEMKNSRNKGHTKISESTVVNYQYN